MPHPTSPQVAAEHTPITQVMTPDPVTVPDDLDVEQLVELLLERGLSRVPVVDAGGRPIGFISKTDLVLDQFVRGDTLAAEPDVEAVGRGRHVHVVEGLVRDVMTPTAESLPETATLADASRRMIDTLLHAMPVVSASGEVIGIVSSSDIVAWVAGARLPSARDGGDRPAAPPGASAGARPPAMKVGELMSQPAVTCRRTDTLQAIAERMRDHDVGAVIIVDATGHIDGIVTDRDVCLTALDLGRPLDEIRADAAMTGTVLLCHPDDPVEAAETMMEVSSVRRIVVADVDGVALGTLTIDDLAVEALRELEAGVEPPQIPTDAIAKVIGYAAQPPFRGMRPVPPGSEAMPRPPAGPR